MLTVNEAKRVGNRACIDKLGRDFCVQHRDNAVFSWGEDAGIVNCFLGVSDQPMGDLSTWKPMLDGGKDGGWPYFVIANVDMASEQISFPEYRTPTEQFST